MTRSLPIERVALFPLSRLLNSFDLRPVATTGGIGHLAYDKVVRHRCRAGLFQQSRTVAGKLRAECNAPNRAVGSRSRQHKAYLRRGIGVELRCGEEECFAGIAVGTTDSDTDLFAFAAHFDMFTFNDTSLEDVEEIARTGDQILRRMIWFLSSGYSITTLLGYFRPTSQGVFLESELMSAPDRKRLKLGIAYSMSQEMRQALADAEIDVEIQKSVSGPQLFTVVSASFERELRLLSRVFCHNCLFFSY